MSASAGGVPLASRPLGSARRQRRRVDGVRRGVVDGHRRRAPDDLRVAGVRLQLEPAAPVAVSHSRPEAPDISAGAGAAEQRAGREEVVREGDARGDAVDGRARRARRGGPGRAASGVGSHRRLHWQRPHRQRPPHTARGSDPGQRADGRWGACAGTSWRSFLGGFQLRCSTGVGEFSESGKLDRDAGAVDERSAPVPLCGRSDDREAEPGSGAGMVAAPEALERPLAVGRIEARPLVTDGDARETIRRPHRHGEGAACRTVQARVLHQVR